MTFLLSTIARAASSNSMYRCATTGFISNIGKYIGLGFAAGFATWGQRDNKHRLYNLVRHGTTAHCCGIVAYVGPKEVEPILMEGIRILQNRGYDSCGIATIGEDGDLVTTKYASKGTTSDCINLVSDEAPIVSRSHFRNCP